jgi:hypothetical protein
MERFQAVSLRPDCELSWKCSIAAFGFRISFGFRRSSFGIPGRSTVFSHPTFNRTLVASCSNSVVVVPNAPRYISPVSRLTKQEQMFLCTVIGLLLVGWTVKTCRTAHPPAVVAQEVIH